MSVSLQVLLVVLVAVGTHRVTRFITYDKLALICVPREKFVRRWGVYVDAEGVERRTSIGGQPTNALMASLAYLWECSWCTSTWVGAGLTYLTWRWPETLLWVLTALGASTATGLLTERERRS